MTNLLINWLISTISLLIAAHLITGFTVTNFTSALIAAVVIGLVNGTLGVVLKFFSFPFILLTLGIASLIINALMIMVAAYFVDGFSVAGFVPAFIGSIVMSIANFLIRMIVPDFSGSEKK